MSRRDAEIQAAYEQRSAQIEEDRQRVAAQIRDKKRAAQERTKLVDDWMNKALADQFLGAGTEARVRGVVPGGAAEQALRGGSDAR